MIGAAKWFSINPEKLKSPKEITVKIRKLLMAGAFAILTTQAWAQEKTSFALDWKFEGPSAAYFAAVDNGHFAAELCSPRYLILDVP